jgi:tetratricopeptide (TPR) repeat protein
MVPATIPNSAAALLNSGDSLFTIGCCAEALRYYDELLDIAPQTAKFWQRKGQALAHLGKHPEAVLYFSKALELEPSNLDAVKGKIRSLIQLGKQPEALGVCSPVLELNPNDKDLLRLKKELLRPQKPKEGTPVPQIQDDGATKTAVALGTQGLGPTRLDPEEHG